MVAYVGRVAEPREEQRTGAAYLTAVTELLQRVRADHPTAGLFEAADLQWWWRVARSTDAVPQLFWFDDNGRPDAAVILTDWGDRVAVDSMVRADATPEWTAHVVARGVAHATALGYTTLSAEVVSDDRVRLDAFAALGFTAGGDGVVEAWLDAVSRPAVSTLPEGYRSSSRADAHDGAHHIAGRSAPDVEARLQQTSLYRPDLDVVVLDARGDVVAYGLCWNDPATRTGLVEPMRTEDDHQRRGLARHVLTRGVHLLATAGAARIKICYEDDNPASGHLYRSVGFVPYRRTVVMTR